MQEDLDKLFERSGAIALVEGEDQDEPVELITKLSDVKGKPVYHFAYGYDESEIYDGEDDMEEEEDEAPTSRRQVQEDRPPPRCWQ